MVICENSELKKDQVSSKELESNNEQVYFEMDRQYNTQPVIDDEETSANPSSPAIKSPSQLSLQSLNEVPYDTSLDELADPRFHQDNNNARAFISKCLVATDSITQFTPETFEQAMACDESNKWKESMRDEIKSIVENKTWKLVSVPPNGCKVIQGRWVYRTKSNLDGKIIKYKSRWVVRGFQQEEGYNFTDTFACVVKPMSYKILFSIAASHDLDIDQMDVKTAFLNSPIHEEVYVEQPHGFEVTSFEDKKEMEMEIQDTSTNHIACSPRYPKDKKSKVNLVCKLEKALYGLKQAPRAWYETLSAFLKDLRLFPLKSDYADFINNQKTLIIAVYVDDILIFGKNREEIQHLKSSLKEKFEMTDMGDAHMYLGMQITRNRKLNTLFLDQRKYIQVVLDRFKMTDCNPVSTPMETGIKLSKRDNQAPLHEQHLYQQMIGCLEYAALATRPDITLLSIH